MWTELYKNNSKIVKTRKNKFLQKWVRLKADKWLSKQMGVMKLPRSIHTEGEKDTKSFHTADRN